MAKTFSHANSGRMYSWWWDSHVSPKNSKWLQDNLTDMDVKVKSMIKLIEEDADSFARRAEMYYKKRPELMKMVEEFYRAYRALAERYDHATGVIRHAHRTMEEAFPNQVPPMLDDSGSDISTPGRGFFDQDEFQNDSPGSFSHSNELKRSNGKFNEGKVRKTLNFHEAVVRERSVDIDTQSPHKQSPVAESEEIVNLRKVLAELEEEKEAGVSRYQQSLDKLSKLESEISRVQEDSKGLAEKARLAEAEAQSLKETLAKLESEKEGSILQYHQCVEKISELEGSVSRAENDAQGLNRRATKAEDELAKVSAEKDAALGQCVEKISELEGSVSRAENDAQELNRRATKAEDELAKVSAEKDAALDQYMSSLELISSLEHKLKCAEEDALMFKDRAEKAEKEVEVLKQAVLKLTEEKEAAEVQYRQSIATISGLESNLSLAQAEAKRLKSEIEKGITDLKGAEEQCLVLERTNKSLHSELEALVLKTGSQSQELTDKQKELGRLWTCVQEERLRFVEAETAFQTLQHLHAQAQEELRSLALELQYKVQALAETETQRKNLQDEVLKVKEENGNLHELSASSAISIKSLENEISSLTETKGKLEEEVGLRVDQRNALQQEIYCMKEELTDLKRKNSSIMEQVLAAGLDAESFGSSVRLLQAENSSLKETGERERSEKLALLEKLKILEQLLEKNSVLENSLSDLNAEMEAICGNIQSLEESCRSLVAEKSSLVDEKASLQTQLQIVNGNLGELTEKNAVLENSLGLANGELEGLKTKSVSLEVSCQILADEKGRVSAEKDALASELQSTEMRLENLETKYAEIGEKCSALEKEKELSVSKIQELQVSLDLQKQEHASFAQQKELQLSGMENEAQRLKEEIRFTKAELEKELDNAFASETEVFILKRCAEDLEGRNLSLLTENLKLSEKSVSLEGMLSNLKQDNQNQKYEILSLCDQRSILRNGVEMLLKALDVVVLHHDSIGRSEHDQMCLNHIFSKLEDIKTSSFESEEEILRRSVELSVLLTMLGDLNLQFGILERERNNIEREFSVKKEQLSVSQNEAIALREMNEEMKTEVMEGKQKQESLMVLVADLQKQLMDLQKEKVEILENSRVLEGENSSLCGEVLSLDCLSIFLKNCIGEKSLESRKLAGELDNLNEINDEMRQRLNATERKFEGLLLMKELELQKLREEHQQKKAKEESLHSELQTLNDEVKMWEAHASDAFVELQVSTLFQTLYEEKIHELSGTCHVLQDENATKDTDIVSLREKASTLAGENEGLNVKFAAYIPAITSLGTHISALEEHTCSNEIANAKVTNHEVLLDPISQLQDLQRRIQSIEKAIISKELLLMHENRSVHSELEAAMKQFAVLRSANSHRRRNSKPSSEVLEADSGILTKDIMLDHVSEFSPYRRSSRREQRDSLESWDTIDQNGSIDLTVNKAATDRTASFHRVKSARKLRNDRNDLPTAEIMVEKELGVDKLEISKRFSEPGQEGGQRKVLERLNSDVQKLTNLEITVQDLKRKLEAVGKSKKGKAMDECDILKEQLEEAYAAILKLFDLNGRLTKNIEDTPLSSSVESDEGGIVRKRKVGEQARRMSERIGRLQLEVQKIQFVLVKLDDEKDKGKGKSKDGDSKIRVPLRNYLYSYGVGRSSQRRKKTPFCGCVQPRTQGD